MIEMQMEMELTAPGAKRPRRRVRETSKAAYADGRERFTGRRADALRWLAAFWNARQVNPTSGELTTWAFAEGSGQSWDWTVLYVRRGLSDLKRTGVVEVVPQGKRPCRTTGSSCETWRVVSR